ncbi:MAG: OmpH family outer membrane protein [bacterium]
MSVTSINKVVSNCAGLLALAVVSLSAAPALAQETATSTTQAAAVSEKAPVILIVDQARLVAASKAGASIAEQMKLLQDTANKELEKKVSALAKEAEDLKAKQGKVSDDEYAKQAQVLSIKQQNLTVLREIKVRELAAAEQNAIKAVGEEMRPILKEIVDARGATVLLDRSSVMYAATATDITDEALAKLDDKLTTVKVERVSLMNEKK